MTFVILNTLITGVSRIIKDKSKVKVSLKIGIGGKGCQYFNLSLDSELHFIRVKFHTVDIIRYIILPLFQYRNDS